MRVFGGRSYEALRGSDVDRDGMYLEVTDDTGEVVGEVFFSDVTGEMTLTTFTSGVPLELAEWLIAEAKVCLPPISES